MNSVKKTKGLLMKTKLHIHTDNEHWAGCENMPGIFLQDKRLNERFDITFSYRYSTEYIREMAQWVDFKKLAHKPIPIKSPVSVLYTIRPFFKYVMALGYFCNCVEVVKMLKLLRMIKPSIIHTNAGGYPGATSCNSAVIAGRLAGIPKITYMINSTTRDLLYWKPMTKLVKKNVTKFVTASNHLVKNSQFLWDIKWEDCKMENSELVGCPSNFTVIPNTILWKDPIPKEEVRSYLGVKPDEVMFLCCGVLEKRKGFNLAIDAFDNLHCDEYKPRALVIAGRGSQEGDLEYKLMRTNSKIISYQMDFYKMVFGKKIDDYSLINACDVLAVPSITDEDFPNVILIAMMYGKPIIASRLAGIPEQIDSVMGRLMEIGNVKELTNCMNYYLGDGIRGLAGEYARVKFNTCYSNEVIIQKWIDLWEGNNG
uniref:Putative glycosyltransferase n=1 Tax=viral metagenome TaxID=1070528 RepID=A0A6M3K2M0_9ZZZZ